MIGDKSDPQIAQTEKSSEHIANRQNPKGTDKQAHFDSCTEKKGGDLDFEAEQNTLHAESEAVIVNRNPVVRNLEFEGKPLLEAGSSGSKKRQAARDKNEEGEDLILKIFETFRLLKLLKF